jgi:predicted O-linked N-acetylglucosamine transferase (SPINDLY family)
LTRLPGDSQDGVLGAVRRGLGRLLSRAERRAGDLTGAGPHDEPRPAPPQVQAETVVARAVELLGVGDTAGAQREVTAGLTVAPATADLHHLAGIIHIRRGEIAAARHSLLRAAELAPGDADVHADLANAKRLSADRGPAERSYRRALAIEPRHASATLGLATLLAELGRHDEACALLEPLVEAHPEHADARRTLADLLFGRDAFEQAIDHYRALTDAGHADADVDARLGLSLGRLGRLEEAVRCYEAGLARSPDAFVLHNDFALVLAALHRHEEAEQHLRRARALNPGFVGAAINLGNVLTDVRRLDEAIGCYRDALELEPGHADALNNLGNALKNRGDVLAAIPCYRDAVRARPGFAQAHSNLLFALQYDPGVEPAELLREHRRWTEQHAAHLFPPEVPQLGGDPDAVLRIGYVSGDFRAHPIGYFIEPALANHGPGFHVTCYADDAVADDVTARLRQLPDRWRSTAGLSDADVADLVRADRIDILIDLAGHTAGNRLLVFARKPAPVQASWIGYLHSTGLAAMDHYIADAVMAPPGEDDGFVEQVVRLPGCFLCYGEPADTPPVSPGPSARGERPVFGSFCNLAKISTPVIECWGALLQATPEARLLLKNSAFADAGTVGRVRDAFERTGVDHDRLEFRGQSTHSGYLAEFTDVDVLLDTFPFSGGTISCDALWMGVPVVTLTGATVQSRTSASVLHALALDDLVCTSVSGYVETAAALAADVTRLATLRRELRQRFAASSLGDATRFTADLESAYRKMIRSRLVR